MNFKKIALLFIATAFFASCHKNDSPVGVYILPGSDQLGAAYAEIPASVSYTIFDDTTYTKNISNANIFGSMNDPVFGRSDASIYSSFEVPGEIALGALGPNPVLDSAVLILVYAHGVATLGDTSQPLSLDVFPLTEKIHADSSYYSSRNISYNKNYNLIEGGQSKSFYPRLNTLVKANKDDQVFTYPEIRVRLRKEFGEMLFNYNYLGSLSAFQNVFPGLFITANRSVLPQPAYGSIFYIDMNSSQISLYYHNDNGVQPVQPIKCGPNSLRFGHFEHDRKFLAEPGLANQLYSPFDTLNLGKNNIYLQGNAGLKVKIKFPQLSTWADSNIVINKAQLEFRPDLSKSDYLNTVINPYPARLYLEGADPVTGKPATLIENLYAFGGTFDASANLYAFEIPHTIANIVKRNSTNTTFYVSIFENAIYPQRVVLGGCANTTYPCHIRLWYTRLNFPKK
jgi:hypothetical protein